MKFNELDQLQGLQVFQGIQKDDLYRLLRCCGAQLKIYRKGEIIILDEDYLNWAGIVVSGEIQLFQETMQGTRSLMLLLHRGELFGESFACGFQQESRMFVGAVCRAEVLLLPFDRVLHRCDPGCEFHRRLAENMVPMLADKNVRLMERMQIVSQRSLREKVQTYLYLEQKHYEQLPREERNCPDGWFEISHNRTQMAEFLCADRTALSRVLTEMKEEKQVDFDKNMFRLT